MSNSDKIVLRIKEIRAKMLEINIDAYLISTKDEFLSEYAPDYAKRLEYLTGFTGSNAICIISKDNAIFFTDGRYTSQAEVELPDQIFTIENINNLNAGHYEQILKLLNLNLTCRIAYDPKIFSSKIIKYFSFLNLFALNENPVDELWNKEGSRASFPISEVYDYGVQYAGVSHVSKLESIRAFLKTKDLAKQKKEAALFLTDPDSICWLLNLRAHDIEFTPTFLSYALVSKNEIFIFCYGAKQRQNINKFRPEVQIIDINELSAILDKHDYHYIFDENQASDYTAKLLSKRSHSVKTNPIMGFKSIKCDSEIKYAKLAHVQDAVAVIEFLAWLKSEELNKSIANFSEYDLSERLRDYRKQRENYVMDSFPAICGYRENGAIIHYRADKLKAKRLEESGLLLIDSGGQYLGGTTDITRTINIGAPNAEHKKFYTLVLKGHINLAVAKFPANKIEGANLDILARQPLWNIAKDYAHGTGHGVGSFLSVHEGPQNISPKGASGLNSNALIQKGMILSNEPGYYEPGNFGIRVENLIYAENSEYANFLQFNNLTLVPYCKELIDFTMLEPSELRYLKDYYKQIKEIILPKLESNIAKKWLEDEINIGDSLLK